MNQQFKQKTVLKVSGLKTHFFTSEGVMKGQSLVSCIVAAFAPMGWLAPWDTRHRNSAGCCKRVSS